MCRVCMNCSLQFWSLEYKMSGYDRWLISCLEVIKLRPVKNEYTHRMGLQILSFHSRRSVPHALTGINVRRIGEIRGKYICVIHDRILTTTIRSNNHEIYAIHVAEIRAP